MPEFSLVVLCTPIDLDDGRTLAVGAEGAIVAVWADGEAYLVEFVAPFHAVVTVPASNLLRAPADE